MYLCTLCTVYLVSLLCFASLVEFALFFALCIYRLSLGVTRSPVTRILIMFMGLFIQPCVFVHRFSHHFSYISTSGVFLRNRHFLLITTGVLNILLVWGLRLFNPSLISVPRHSLDPLLWAHIITTLSFVLSHFAFVCTLLVQIWSIINLFSTRKVTDLNMSVFPFLAFVSKFFGSLNPFLPSRTNPPHYFSSLIHVFSPI